MVHHQKIASFVGILVKNEAVRQGKQRLTSVPCKPVYAADMVYFFTPTRRVRPSTSCIGMQTLFQDKKRKVYMFQRS